MISATEFGINRYAEAFAAFENNAAGNKLPWLRQLRARAFEYFSEAGFPTTRIEDWRFTNVSAISQTPFESAVHDQPLPPGQLESLPVPDTACQLVFINGRFAPRLSSPASLPDGITVSNLADRLLLDPTRIEAHLGRYLNIRRDAFCALNTAFFEDGAYVHIAKGRRLEQPIYLQFVSTGAERPTINHPRNLIVVEPSSQVTVIEDYASIDGAETLCNSASELFVGEDAVVSHYRIERERSRAFSMSTLRIQQARNAVVSTHSVLLGGRLVRNNVHPALVGPGAECLINGLFVGGAQQHLDNYMLVDHAAPHCSSRQFYNGILADRAHGVFHGRIIVHKDANQTDAKQTNRNLLLSDDAQIDTKPQLEIHADDVKCTHGATIGQINEDALFYLRSRGIDELAAREVLLLAFAGECLDRMRERPIRRAIEVLVQGHVAAVHKGQLAGQAPSFATPFSEALR